MYKAIQELKNHYTKIVGFTLLAAAIGFYGYQNDSVSSSDSVSDTQKPQVTQIQKPPVTSLPLQEATVMSDSRLKYIVRNGDNYWTIANILKPANVEIDSYISVLKLVNSRNKVLRVNDSINVPNHNDLKDVILPDIKIHFSIKDETLLSSIKFAEGNIESQSKNKRHLLGGKTGSSYRNSRFYPYKDMKGNFTIGYGHFLGKSESNAKKYINGISKRQADALLISDLKRTYTDFVLLLQRKRATDLSPEKQRVLFEMAFTMGVDKLSTFKGMWRSVERNNDKRFKHEIKSSLWYTQVKNRADILLTDI